MKTLYFITEARFKKDGLGRYYTEGSFVYNSWSRYLNSFGNVVVVARVCSVDGSPGMNYLASGPNVSFIELPYYIGITGFIRQYTGIIKELSKLKKNSSSCYLMRVPGVIGFCASRHFIRSHIPYAVEVVGDPYDVGALQKGFVNHILTAISVRQLKSVVKNAAASIYVTKERLQKRYPCEKDGFTTYASNVIIKENQIAKHPHKTKLHSPIRIVSVGMLSQMYKGPDVAIEVVKRLNDEGVDTVLEWIGDGRYKNEMINYTSSLGLSSKVHFIGLLPAGEAIRKELNESDIFLMTSRTEGLPRALIEAMSAGIYCISTDVGGIPELLDSRWLVHVDDVDAIVRLIKSVIQNESIYDEQVNTNLNVVHDYTEEVLSVRRTEFYNTIKSF